MVIRLHCSLLLLVMFVGCAHRNDPTMDLMQSEMRWLEDQVYMLESELEQSCYDLCKCRQASRERMIWQQATTTNTHAAAPPATTYSESTPAAVDPAPLEPVVESPIVEGVVEPGLEPPRLGLPVDDPGVIEMQMPRGGVPLDSLPYQLVPSGPFADDCPGCDPAAIAPEPAYGGGVTDVPIADVPIVNGEDSTTIEMSNDPVETPPTLDGVQQESPAELPAPLEPTPSGVDTMSPSTDVPSMDGDSMERIFDTSPDAPDTSGESETDGREFLPEPAMPPAGERPNIEDLDDALDARQPDSDRFSIRLQSHVHSERIESYDTLADDVPAREPEEPLKLFVEEADPAGERLDAHVTHVVVKARQLKWKQHYATVKEHDLVVEIQPRNADGKYVELPAEMSLVVLDRNQSPENARVARWDFDATDVATYVQGESKDGIRFELDWPGARPDSDELFVFARYNTIDGRKLEARARLLPPKAEDEDKLASRADRKPGGLTLTPKGSHQWSQVSGSPSAGWTVVDIGSDSGSAGEHATVGYESASDAEWMQQRVSRLAGTPAKTTQATSIKPVANAVDSKDVREPEPLPASAIQNATPIIQKPRVAKPTWKPYR